MTPPNQSVPDLKATARDIFLHALEASSIPAAFDHHVREADGILRLSDGAVLPLAEFRRVRVIALGKAALPMLDVLLSRLPALADLQGVCSAPALPSAPDQRIAYFLGGHPAPTQTSFDAARSALFMLRELGARDLALFLLSGGASAMLELPIDPGITLDEAVAFHRTLVDSGAPISEINCVRKQFSAVKGGRLAEAAGDARELTLAISDVPEGKLDALGSGPTLPNSSTPSEAWAVLQRYNLLAQFPPRVRAFFERTLKSASAPTASDLSNERILAGDHRPLPATPNFITLLSNQDVLRHAANHARSLGFHVEVDNHCDDWPCAEAAAYLLDRLCALRRVQPRVCLLSGGEITVALGSIPGSSAGIGGRNQHFALECSVRLASAAGLDGSSDSIAILSAGTDGIDGNSAAAGAVADATTTQRAADLGINAAQSLARFDSGTLFTQLGDTIRIGPTGNNLRDLRVLLAAPWLPTAERPLP